MVKNAEKLPSAAYYELDVASTRALMLVVAGAKGGRSRHDVRGQFQLYGMR